MTVTILLILCIIASYAIVTSYDTQAISTGEETIDPMLPFISTLNETTSTMYDLYQEGTNDETTNLTRISSFTLADPFYLKKGLWKIAGSVSEYNARPVDVNGPKMQSSYIGNGTVNSLPVKDVGTMMTIPISLYNDSAHTDSFRYVYTSPILYTKGEGNITSRDGEMVNYEFQGIGHFGADKKLRNTGSIFFNTDPTGKLAYLNEIVGIYKDEIEKGVWEGDGVGKSLTKVWELH